MHSRFFSGLGAAAFSLSLLLAGCGDTDSFVFNGAAPSVPSRTSQLAVYMVGSDLQSADDAAADDLLEMVDGLRSMTEEERSRLDLLVAFGGADQDGWRGVKWVNAAQLIVDSQDQVFGNESEPDSYLLQDDGADMADPATLGRFLRFLNTDRAVPDDRFVILWNHGGAYTGFGYDENSEKLLSLQELDAAFSSSGLPRLGLLGFDACLMATVEVAASMRSHSALMIASEETEPGHGWNYRHVVPALLRSSGLREYGAGLVDNYVDPRSHPYDQPGKTLSLLDLEKTSALTEALDRYGESYAATLSTVPASAATFVRAVVRSQAFGLYDEDQRYTLDLLDFVRNGAGSGGAAREGLLAAIEATVLHSNDDGSFSGAGGLAIVPPDLTARRLTVSPYPSTGWLSLVQASLQLINSDLIPPELTGVSVVPGGIEVAFRDALLTRVDVLHGFRQPDGSLLRIESRPASPLPAPDRFFANLWDGRGFYLSFSSSEAPRLLPARQRSDIEVSFNGVEVDVYSAPIEFLAARDPDRTFKDGDLVFYASGDEVLDYAIETRQVDDEGSVVVDRRVEKLERGDQLKVFARTYRPGPALDATVEQLGSDIAIADTVHIARGAVVPPAGSELSFAVAAVDFGGSTTVTPLQSLPPVSAGAGPTPTAQVELQLTGSGNVSQNSWSGAGTQVQAGDTTAAPKRFVARVPQPGSSGSTRVIQLTLPKPLAQLSAGNSFPIDGVQTTASYIEANQAQPTASKIFQAQSGRLVVDEVTRSGGKTTLVLRFDNVVVEARGLSASGKAIVTGTVRFGL